MESYQRMNLFIKIILIFLILIPEIISQDCKSRLIIETDLDSVNIFINDSLISAANKFDSEFDEGWYKILVVENDNVWDKTFFADSVFLSDCITKELNYKKEKEIYLDTYPQDAYVFWGDSLLGNTPLFIKSNNKTLTLNKPGFAVESLSVDELAQQNIILLTSLQLPKEESFFYSTTFHVLAATAVALGTVSAYYKLKADDTYDKYKISGDNNLLDDTKKYDVISGITFTALQINFGYILYKFLTE
jgi:hypothetical protein